MSRIGNRVLNIPNGVTVTLDGNKMTVKGPKGELSKEFNKDINIEVKETEKEPEGEFIGEVGNTIMFSLKSIEKVHSHNWISSWGWRDNGHG